MAATREQIMTALLAKLKATNVFLTVERRVRPWSDVSEQPALFARNVGDHYEPRSPLPAKRTMSVELWIYAKSGRESGGSPGAVLNNCLDAIDTALKPDVMTNRQTLGGLVEHCRIEGEGVFDPGDLDSQAKAVVPLKILIP